MSFLLPAGLSAEAARALERACIIGGPDNMPWPTRAKVEPGLLTLSRDVDESGCMEAPWEVEGFGRLMGSTGTLMERREPYDLAVELARGKVNQVRCQVSDWQYGGLQVSDELIAEIHAASLAFGRAAIRLPTEGQVSSAQLALIAGYQSADKLVQTYIDQMFQARHRHLPRLETTLGCRLGASTLPSHQAEGLLQACNSVSLAFNWKEIEVEEGNYRWEAYDQLLDWAEQQGLAVTAGPLITFTRAQLPEWIWIWERDLSSLAAFLGEYVESVVQRYRGRIRTWNLCAASNNANVLGLSEDELLWLTVRLAEEARQIDSSLALIVGVSQPWGEYMAGEDRTHSPFIFADTLIRAGVNLAALDLDIVMAPSQGSYCRDLLEVSRMIDLYTLLGSPLRVTMAYPSSDQADPNAESGASVDAGSWRGGFSPETQAAWAEQFVGLALCKPSVKAIHWAHLSDALPHSLPHCGLFDASGQPKPVLQRLQKLREEHLR